MRKSKILFCETLGRLVFTFVKKRIYLDIINIYALIYIL